MTEHLDASLALAKQAYDELVQSMSVEALEKFNFGEGPKRDQIESLLRKIHTSIVAIR